jgi:hypothetical protein
LPVDVLAETNDIFIFGPPPFLQHPPNIIFNIKMNMNIKVTKVNPSYMKSFINRSIIRENLDLGDKVAYFQENQRNACKFNSGFEEERVQEQSPDLEGHREAIGQTVQELG